MWRVLPNRCKHRQNPSHRGYGYGIHAGAEIRHRTRTRVTRGPKTAGKPVPVRNPIVTPAPHELHLHEAIQRILLTYIWNMKDSDHILLGQKLRAVTMQRYDVRVLTVEPLSFGSKRPRNDEELPTEHRKSEFLSLMKSPFSHMCHLFREEQALE
jgi:hypothetical protein